MIYELREYDIEPGKMRDYDKRFEEVDIVSLFEKHGMKVIGFWHTVIGENAQNRLVYMLGYPSLGEREKSWAAFQTDPDWQQARAESEKNGPLVAKAYNQILRPTAYSPRG